MSKHLYNLEFLFDVEAGMTLRISAGALFKSEDDIYTIKNLPITSIIRENCIELRFHGSQLLLLNSSHLYSFELLTISEQENEPVDITGLPEDTIDKLFSNDYFPPVKAEYEGTNLGVIDVYDQLSQLHPNKKYFPLTLLDFKIKRIHQ